MNDIFTRPQSQRGWIEVIVGCMFSGKTEELIKQVRRARIARQKLQTFKPLIDQRYSVEDVASHNLTKLASYPIRDVSEIRELINEDTEVIAIDEAQFFGPEIIELATEFANAGKRVIIAGLDTDWQGKPFGPMPQLMAIAETVTKQHAICRVCGGLASRTQRLTGATENILVGSTEAYEARCRQHFDPDLASAHLTPPGAALNISEL